MALEEQHIRKLLLELIDPLTNQPLEVEQRITGITIKDKMVQISLDIEKAEWASRYDATAKAIEKGLMQHPNINNATVIMTAEKPAGSPSDKAAPHQRAHDMQEAQTSATGIAKVKNIIAIASGKGGVGKSTTAVNLAHAFHELGFKTGLLDADIYGPSVPRMLGSQARPRSPDNKTIIPNEIGGIKTLSMGFLISEEEPVIWRGPMVMGALNQMIKDALWDELDILLIDLPPGTGDAQLTLVQQVPLSGAIIVSTPQDIALLDARKGLNMFKKTDVAVLGIIENMSLFICPHCQHESHIFGHGGAKQEAERLNVPFLGEIPLEIEIRKAADAGHAIVLSQKESKFSAIYRDIAKSIVKKLGLG